MASNFDHNFGFCGKVYEGLIAGEHRKGGNYNIITTLFYTTQMFLRKHLDQVHRQLYGSEYLNQSLTEVQAMIDGHKMIVDEFMAMLQPRLKWNTN